MAHHGEADIGMPLYRAYAGRALKIALVLTLPLMPLSAVHGQADDPVLDRQLIMQALEDEAAELGNIAARLSPPDKMAERSRNVAKLARESYESFKPNVPGGAAKPEIWSNWADYSQRMEAFIANADKMTTAAEAGDINAVTELLVDALPCKQCHDVYREKKS
jgi:cytochrome c556